MRIVVTHGGTGSTPKQADGPRKAAKAGLDQMGDGGPLEAVVEAVRILEDDERFNAGTGSAYRFDGKTIEMDAAVAREDGKFGAVACIREVRNPIFVARTLLGCPTNVVSGEAATRYARALGFPTHDPGTKHQRKQYVDLIDRIRKGKAAKGENQWTADELRKAWNYPTPFGDVFPDGFPRSTSTQASALCDTIGAVATDGNQFAAAASTGGTTTTLLGRIGDTPTFGAGLIAGHSGAVACTGNGEAILRDRLASRVSEWLDAGVSPQECVDRVKTRVPGWTDLFVVIASRASYAAGGNRDIAWAVAKDE